MLAGDTVPLSEFAFGQAVPEGFVFSPDGRYLYGSSYYTGVSNIYRYEVATGKVEAVSNAETGFLPSAAARGRSTRVARIHGRRLRSRHHRSQADPGFERDHISRRGGCGEVSRGQDLAGPRTWHGRRQGAGHEARTLRAVAQPRACQRVSGASGLQELRRRRLPVQLRGSAELRVPRHHHCVHAELEPARGRARSRRAQRPLRILARGALVEPVRFL